MQRDARPVLMLFLASAALVLSDRAGQPDQPDAAACAVAQSRCRGAQRAGRAAAAIDAARAGRRVAGRRLRRPVGHGCWPSAALAMLQGFIPAEWLHGRPRCTSASAAWALALAVGLLGRVAGRGAGAVAQSPRRPPWTSCARAGAAAWVCAAAAWTACWWWRRWRWPRSCCARPACSCMRCTTASRLQLGFTDDHMLTFELAPVKAHYPDDCVGAGTVAAAGRSGCAPYLVSPTPR